MEMILEMPLVLLITFGIFALAVVAYVVVIIALIVGMIGLELSYRSFMKTATPPQRLWAINMMIEHHHSTAMRLADDALRGHRHDT